MAGCEHTNVSLHLTELNWVEEVENNDKLITYVEFSAPWCRWSGTHSCDDMAAAWEELANKYGPTHEDVLIGEVDCGRWPGYDNVTKIGIPSMCSIHGIKEYPTVRAFSPFFGLHGMNYSGESEPEPLNAFLEKQLTKICKVTQGDQGYVASAVCSTQDANYMHQWGQKSPVQVETELKRLKTVFFKAVNEQIETTKHFEWMGHRINILKQLNRLAPPQEAKDEL